MLGRINHEERPRATVQKNKGYWHARFRVRIAETGKLKQISVSTHVKAGDGNTGKRAAEKVMNQIVDEYMQRNCILYEEMLFTTYLDDYLKRKEFMVRPTTYLNELNMYEKHIKPYFFERKIKLSELSAIDIERYIIEKKGTTSLSANTIRKHCQFMHVALQDAVRKEFLRRNPVDGVNKLKKEPYEAEVYSEPELQKLLSVTKGTAIEVPVYICVHFGLRRSEVIGLRWSTIDFDKKTMFICNTVTKKKCSDGKKKTEWVAAEITKTRSSRRLLPLSDSDVAYLKSVKEKQDGYLRETKEYMDYVCINEVGKRLDPEFVSNKFKKITEESGMRRIRFHDLRHSAITFLIEKGVSISVTQAIAGHSTVRTTIDTYTHINLDQERKAISVMESAFSD